jgi:hypothetical protein
VKLLKYLGVALLLLVAGFIAWTGGITTINAYMMKEQAPAQPIEFSHRLHAGNNEIPCLFCHIYADRSTVAGVPSVERCMGCHSSLTKDTSDIRKLKEYWDQEQPIPWVKVYDLPDYIYFPHKRHVKGGVGCELCHGDVAGMDRVERIPEVRNMVMGWCVNCHRERNQSIDCWQCHI